MKISKGTIALFAGDFVPKNWAPSQGQAKVYFGRPSADPDYFREIIQIVCLDPSEYEDDDCFIGLITTIEENEDVPRGWELCKGQMLSKHQYEALHLIIRYRYGGHDNMFCLPEIANLGTKRYIICLSGSYPGRR